MRSPDWRLALRSPDVRRGEGGNAIILSRCQSETYDPFAQQAFVDRWQESITLGMVGLALPGFAENFLIGICALWG